MQEKIYYLAEIETIINKNTITKLNNYSLEYYVGLENYPISFYESGNLSLMIGVKIRNNETKKVEWANVYYKIISKNVSVNDINKEEILKKIFLSSIEEQISFILKSETIFKKPYVSSDFSKINKFTQELRISSDNRFSVIKLGGLVPMQIKKEINETFNFIVDEIVSSLFVSKINKYLHIKNKI